MATSPASMPFAIMLISGLPYRIHMYIMEEKAPPAEASMVFMATTPIRRSVPAREEPALNPNHPKARIKVPTTAMGMWCPGMA